MKTLSANADDYCFFDFETRALPGIKPPDDSVVTAGTYRYAKSSGPLLLAYAIGDAPVVCLDYSNYDFRLSRELGEFHDRAVDGKAWFVAWNAAFDRAVWNRAFGKPFPLRTEMTLDAMCQAMAANLPPDLAGASLAVGGPGKRKGGNKLIQLFSSADGARAAERPEEWKLFKDYAMQDVEALRDVWRKTRQLPPGEWRDYWVSERINERGIAVDLELARKAQEVAAYNVVRSNQMLEDLTDIGGIKVTMPKPLARWVYENLKDLKARMILVVPQEPGGDEDDDVSGDVELNLKRQTVVALRAYLLGKPTLTGIEEKVVEVLNLREYGAAASPVKFRKMADQADDDGRLKGSYVLNGAGQTGRFSSRGIQIHNLPRGSLEELEEEAIEDMRALVPRASGPMSAFEKRYGPIGRTLTQLIRPTLIAPEYRTLVWGDWSNIEARVNPWLAFSRSGNAKLATFVSTDNNPDGPDIYQYTAGDLLDCPPDMVTKAERQSHGKVPELSLGFGGGKGALLRMADTYGVHMGEDQAQGMVVMWREKNPWARRFWDTLWEAIQNAMEARLVRFEAGRVSYIFVPDYLGGSLLCGLPCGRLLTYPQCRWEKVDTVNPLTGLKEKRDQITYRKGHGRAQLWYGKACENVVQATAGSLLRAKLNTLHLGHRDWMPVVLHTHDDICVEVDEHLEAKAKAVLGTMMRLAEPWSGGLPLAVKTTANWWFTKAGD